MNTWRNRLAERICNWVLAHIAEGDYAAFVGGAIQYGMTAAARDQHSEEARDE